MDDKETYELIDKKNEDLVLRIEKTLKVQTEFIALETQGIKKSINDLTGEVKKQNGRVDELELWRAECSGRNRAIREGEKKSLSNWRIVGIIAGCIISLIAVLGFVKSLNNDKKFTRELYWKADRMPDSVTRSALPMPRDSVYIHKMELNVKEIIK